MLPSPSSHLDGAIEALWHNLSLGPGICLCLFICAYSPHTSATEPTAGTVQGLVQYEGRIPLSSDTTNEGIHPPLFRVNPDNHGLPLAAVYLVPLHATAAFNAPEPTSEEFVEIDQDDLTFVPHVTAIQSGASILFTNSDIENHNVRALAEDPRNSMNIATSPSTDYDKRFRTEPQHTPIRLTCDIHPWMNAWIFVFEHSFFTLSDAEGNFSIEDVPPGNYQLNVRQPDGRLKAMTEIQVQPNETTSLTISFSKEHIGGKNICTPNPSQLSSTP